VSFLKEDYEKRVLTQTATMADLYTDARDMQVLNVSGLYKEMTVLVQKYLAAEKSSLYILENKKLKLQSYSGYQDFEEKPPEELEPHDAPYAQALEKKEIISINEADYKKSIIGEFPVYCGPLKDSYGQVLGVLNVDNMSLLKFNKVSKKLFGMICTWGSKAIENALNFELVEGRRIIKDTTHVFKFEYFELRLKEALAKAKQTREDFGILQVSIDNFGQVLPDHKNSVLKAISRIIQQNIRAYDIMSHYKNEDEFIVLLSSPEEKGILSIIARIQKQLNLYSLRPFDDDRVLTVRTNHLDAIKDYDDNDDIFSALKERKEARKQKVKA
ncbi:MAG: diguanylate cyclase, partial [Vulcanimicrobiota bacterium]